MSRLHSIVRGFIKTVEAERYHRDNKNRGGMQVSWHGDFCSAAPSVFGKLEWWARELREVLDGISEWSASDKYIQALEKYNQEGCAADERVQAAKRFGAEEAREDICSWIVEQWPQYDFLAHTIEEDYGSKSARHDYRYHDGIEVCARCGMVRNKDSETECPRALPKVKTR